MATLPIRQDQLLVAMVGDFYTNEEQNCLEHLQNAIYNINQQAMNNNDISHIKFSNPEKQIHPIQLNQYSL